MLVKKFEITQNRSLDAMDDIVNRRKMTEFGNIALVEEREDDEKNTTLRLPGVRRGDMASRSFKPEVRVSQMQFSPTGTNDNTIFFPDICLTIGLCPGRAFSAATTEGLMVYSLDSNLIFEPIDLSEDITPTTIRTTLKAKDYSRALIMALKMNESALTREVYENIPPNSVAIVVDTVSASYVERLMSFVVTQMEVSPHIEFHLKWIQAILYKNGNLLQKRTPSIVALLRAVQKSVGRRFEDLSKVCHHNRYTLQYVESLGRVQSKRTIDAVSAESEEDDEMFSDVD